MKKDINEINAFIEEKCGGGSVELQETENGIRVTYESNRGTMNMEADPWVLHDMIVQLTLIKAEIERAGIREGGRKWSAR